MNLSVKEQWIEKLTDNSYKQGHIFMRAEGEFCPLGVLCDIYSKLSGTKWHYHKNIKQWSILGEKFRLPLIIRNWAGISCRLPSLEIEFCICTISYINDLMGYNFKQIADLIEKQM